MDKTVANCEEFTPMDGQHKVSKSFTYIPTIERHLIKYALTKLLEDNPPIMFSRASDFTNAPPTLTIKVGYDQQAQVVDNAFVLWKDCVLRYWEAQVGNEIHLFVDILGQSSEIVEDYAKLYKEYIQRHNFYQGKTLKFTREGLEFMPAVDRPWESVVYDDDTKTDILLNTYEFLNDERYHVVGKKRGILLEGPPGTGKTSMVKAIFHKLRENGITQIYLSDDCFHQMSVDAMFRLFDTYLAPGLMVFEDIDTIGESRESKSSILIGSLLTKFNGINDLTNPIVMMATTNRMEVLDQALTRPQRFNRTITFGYPKYDILVSIFERLFGFEPPEKLHEMYEEGNSVKQAGKFKNTKLTGAHIEDIYQNAKMLAIKQDSTVEKCLDAAMELTRKNFITSIGSESITRGFGFGAGVAKKSHKQEDTLEATPPLKKEDDTPKRDLPKDPVDEE